MSATPAQKIRDPERLYAPEIDDNQIRHLFRDRLTEEGREEFFAELMAALRRAKTEGNLGYVNEVVEAWTRTALVLDESFDEKWRAAQDDAEDPHKPVLSLDEVKAKLQLDQ